MLRNRSIHGRRVLQFLITVAVLSLPIYMAIFALDRPVQESGGLIFALMWVPAAAAVVLLALHGELFRGRGFGRGRGNRQAVPKVLMLGLPREQRGRIAAFCIMALLFPVAAGLLSYGLAWHTGVASFSGEAGAPFVRSLIRAALLGSLFSIPQVLGEEIGWRGFMSRELRASGIAAPDILGGSIWALWHAPLILSGQYASGPYPIVSVLSFTVLLIALHRLWTQWTLRTGSVWPAVIAHGAWNTLIQFVFDGHTSGAMASLWVGDSGIITALAAAALVYLLPPGQSFLGKPVPGKPVPGKTVLPDTAPENPRPEQPGTSRHLPKSGRGILTFLAVFLVLSCPMGAEEIEQDGSKEEPQFSVAAGAGGAVMPPARGVDGEMAMPLPYFELSYGRVLSVGTNGLSFHPTAAAPRSPFSGSLFLRPHMGRFEHFLPNRYSGVGDVPATLEGGFRTGFSFLGIVNFSISAAGDILGRGHGGLHGEGAMALQLPLHEIGLFAAFEVAVMAGDASYMDSLYGVDAGQARSSAFEAYKAKGGVEATRGAVTMRKRMGEHWSIIGKIGMMRLAGSLEESPLVEEKQQYSLQLLTAYRF